MNLDFVKLEEMILAIFDYLSKAFWNLFKGAVDSTEGYKPDSQPGDDVVDKPEV